MNPAACKADALIQWVNAVDDSFQVYELMDLRDGWTLAAILLRCLDRPVIGIVTRSDCMFNANLRASNLRRLLIMLEEFYSGLLKKPIYLKAFVPETIAQDVGLDTIVCLMELGTILHNISRLFVA